jgi:hypothetical protein
MWAMSFFELPRPTASVFRAAAVSPPAWLGPPHNVLPGIAPVELVVARTEETVVAIVGIDAYPEGSASPSACGCEPSPLVRSSSRT